VNDSTAIAQRRRLYFVLTMPTPRRAPRHRQITQHIKPFLGQLPQGAGRELSIRQEILHEQIID
jgi:hypothetical protein